MAADFCPHIADDLVDQEGRVVSARNRYGLLDARSLWPAFGRATESTMERARPLRTWFLFRKDDVLPSCPRDRWCAPRSCAPLGCIVPDNQESRRCFDRPT